MSKGFFEIRIERIGEGILSSKYKTEISGAHIDKRHVMRNLGDAIVHILEMEVDEDVRAVLLENLLEPLEKLIDETYE